MERFLEIALTAIASLWVGSFLSSYMKKKGENLATHEDIDKLLAQMRAVTQATKEIESKISNEMWDRQKQWEIKKDAIFDAMKEMGRVENSLIELMARYIAFKSEIVAEDERQARVDAGMRFQQALMSLNRANMLLALVCSDEVRNKISVIVGIGTNVRKHLSTNDVNEANKKTRELMDALSELTFMIRAELRIDEAA